RRLRLIPAHAGSTHPPRGGRSPQPAHPRSRGVDAAWGDSHAPELGSSPLTRGRQLADVAPVVLAGLIPAHAGSTLGKRWNFKQASERVGRIPLLLT
ncbi:MAG: hypothetical protein Q605_AUC00999G0011, partial [Actinomyces urogenitalis DORA_12]